ncbi:MAG: FAD-dependent oxidoreductase [Armatimonadetes bacterium]|nr:FAD-dependent oxidoreductase [Armatimonadota bacterium]MBX3109211.1 FAD-dependent oxidoreductase [Fimbriimonadaceae bacterium]
MKIAVVGAGVMGLNAALAAQERGHETTVFEQFEPMHTQGSSHGRSRIIRLDYPDPFYLKIMLEGYPLWKSLNQRLGVQVFHECGIFTFGDPDHPDLQTLEQGLIEQNIHYDKTGPGQSHFPALHLDEEEIAIHNPVAGWVDADLFRTYARTCILDHGGAWNSIKIERPESLVGSFDSVIVTAGSWAKKMFNLPLTVTAQTFAYLQVPNPKHHTKVWIETGEHGIYGFPPESIDRPLIKFGVHSSGDEVDPDDPARPVSEEKLWLLRDFAQRRFAIPNPELTGPQACLYSRTSTEDFLWGQIGGNLFWASPCSGHGFKFGPWMGERLVDFAEGKLLPQDFPRFCLP